MMTEANRRTVILLLVISILLVGLAIAIYVPPGKVGSGDQEFVVQEGDGSSLVARLLAQEGLVRNRYLFLFFLFSTGQEKKIKAGRYSLSSGMNIPEVAKILTEGRAESDDLVVTIPEGFNVWEIDRELTEQGLIQRGDFFKQAIFKEGFLFPDTYRLKKRQSAQQIIDELILKMKINFDNKANEDTRDQVVVASLLEKEVRRSEDMALVAGIIYKRLRQGMPLQIDASVAYGACLEQSQNFVKDVGNEALTSWGCDVTQVNLLKWIKIDGSYNTYTRTGLPLGPISNPGMDSILAAI